ncbi:MAG: RimK family protein [Oligoflexales bacterium]
MKIYLVVDDLEDWKLNVNGVDVVTSFDYLTNPKYQDKKGARVFNLCRSYNYQESGYYVSLLGQARSHKAIPSVETVLEMRSQSLLRIRSQELDDLIQSSLADIRGKEFELSIYFGRSLAKKYDRLTNELHKIFHAPLIRTKFAKKDKWRITQIAPIALKDVPKSHRDDLEDSASEYFVKRLSTRKLTNARFSLAILVDPTEKLPPSNEKAIKKFIKAADELEIETELITKDDMTRLAEFDALFIRTTTAVNHYTYRFAQKAEALGLFVIDDPSSILKCTNKVYLAELFTRHDIPAPKTIYIHKNNLESIASKIHLPVVLKRPDSSFSQGVIKVTQQKDLQKVLFEMLEDSDLVIGQEYIETSFDWRIGILNGKAIYACKYHMARNHWQIYKQSNNGQVIDGEADTFSLDRVPKDLIAVAVKAASFIGKGLYGIDIKEKDGKYFIIEINDNPNIDSGCEDLILKDGLYKLIMEYFLKKMEMRTKGITCE